MTGKNAPPRRPAGAASFAAAMLTNPAGVLGALTPAIITALMGEAGLLLRQAAAMLAIEFAAMTVAIMAAPTLIGQIGTRSFAATALCATLAGQLTSLHGPGPALALARGITGVGEGALYGLGLAALARAPNPDRTFGVVVLSNQILSAVLLTLSSWAHRVDPAAGIFTLLIGFLLVTGCFVPALDPQPIAQNRRAGASGPPVLSLVPGLAGVFLFAAGFGAVWPLVASIGQARGVGSSAIGGMLAVAGIAGIVGAIAAIGLADRLGRKVPLVLGSLVMAMALFGTVQGPLPIAVPAVLGLWSLLVPYYLGSFAAADRSGRLVGLAGAMLPLGMAFGQAFAGHLLARAPLQTLGWTGAAIQLTALLAMLVLAHRAPSIEAVADAAA